MVLGLESWSWWVEIAMSREKEWGVRLSTQLPRTHHNASYLRRNDSWQIIKLDEIIPDSCTLWMPSSHSDILKRGNYSLISTVLFFINSFFFFFSNVQMHQSLIKRTPSCTKLLSTLFWSLGTPFQLMVWQCLTESRHQNCPFSSSLNSRGGIGLNLTLNFLGDWISTLRESLESSWLEFHLPFGIRHLKPDGLKPSHINSSNCF